MNKLLAVFSCIILITGLVIGCAGTRVNPTPAPAPTPNPSPISTPIPAPTPYYNAAGTAQGLKDGTYTAESTRNEKGWYAGTVTIKDEKYDNVEFIKYNAKGQKVSMTQYKHPPTVRAVEQYPKLLIERQDASNVDLIPDTAETYNGFQEIIAKIRKQAIK